MTNNGVIKGEWIFAVKYCVRRTTKDFGVPVHNAGIILFHELKKGTASDRNAIGA